jgi:hypothetical protein
LESYEVTDGRKENDLVLDDLIRAAFQLAYFIHENRATAMHIAISALRKLRVASTAQGRRAYYTPTGQSGYRATRTKVSLSNLHLLQRLVYIESEIYERIAEERQWELGQMDMIIRFIKHLVRITIKRNSFYVSLALSRVLHDYTTAEAIEIYNCVVQDPERSRENYYYRSQKAALMRELKERFGDMLRIRKAKHGEERFEPQEDSASYLELINACLLQFMPWQSKCVLPADFDPIKSVVTPLLFKGNLPDEEHATELNRIHTLLHPRCFGRLVLGLGLASPDQRLNVPSFFLSSDEPGSLGRRLDPPQVSGEELRIISDELTKEAKRRKKYFGPILSVRVDGVERGQLDLNRTDSLSFEIEAGSDLIEVWGGDPSEEIIVATHFLTYDETNAVSSKSETVSEGGQLLSFDIVSSDKSSSENPRMLITIRYRETRPMASASGLLRRLTSSLPGRIDLREWSGIPNLAKVFLFVVISVAGFLVYSRIIRQPERPVVSVQPEPGSSNKPGIAPPDSSHSPGEANRSDGKQKPDSSESANPRNERPQSDNEADRTRGLMRRSNPVKLLTVKRIYISTSDDGLLSQQIAELLTKRLSASGRFSVVGGKEDADAMLDVYAIRELNGGKVSLGLQLVTAEGETIWPRMIKATKYSGYPADVTDRAVRDLFNDIQRMERKR